MGISYENARERLQNGEVAQIKVVGEKDDLDFAFENIIDGLSMNNQDIDLEFEDGVLTMTITPE